MARKPRRTPRRKDGTFKARTIGRVREAWQADALCAAGANLPLKYRNQIVQALSGRNKDGFIKLLRECQWLAPAKQRALTKTGSAIEQALTDGQPKGSEYFIDYLNHVERA